MNQFVHPDGYVRPPDLSALDSAALFTARQPERDAEAAAEALAERCRAAQAERCANLKFRLMGQRRAALAHLLDLWQADIALAMDTMRADQLYGREEALTRRRAHLAAVIAAEPTWRGYVPAGETRRVVTARPLAKLAHTEGQLALRRRVQRG